MAFSFYTLAQTPEDMRAEVVRHLQGRLDATTMQASRARNATQRNVQNAICEELRAIVDFFTDLKIGDPANQKEPS